MNYIKISPVLDFNQNQNLFEIMLFEQSYHSADIFPLLVYIGPGEGFTLHYGVIHCFI